MQFFIYCSKNLGNSQDNHQNKNYFKYGFNLLFVISGISVNESKETLLWILLFFLKPKARLFIEVLACIQNIFFYYLRNVRFFLILFSILFIFKNFLIYMT